MKNICILGSTGSIGTQALEIVENNPDKLTVVGLSADKNVDLMAAQIRKFRPAHVAMADAAAARALKILVADVPVRIYAGMEGLEELATLAETDMLLSAIVGMVGIRPIVAAIEAKTDIALANKESLVCAGHIIMALAQKNGVNIIPVDSEHSAIFQALRGERTTDVERIILTASGGPFRGMDREALNDVRAADALKHPNWSMGPKITIDSATMINKGLEVIEAHHLFGLPPEKIRVVVHPQSIVHSMVEYVDGAHIAQLGLPDMKLPIQYALFYPDRRALPGEKLDFTKALSLKFEPPDLDSFKGLALAYEALATGHSMPCVYNAANERAVGAFLAGKIGFLQIYEQIAEAMHKHQLIKNPTLDDILHINI